MSGFHGVVYTKNWIAGLILDLVGYTADKQLWAQTILEPSCGDGSFLRPIIERLLASAQRDGKASFAALRHAVVAYELDENAIKSSRALTLGMLTEAGIEKEEAEQLAKDWIRQEDFLLVNAPACRYIVGNPPYVRSTEISEEARKKYCSALQTMTKGCDIYIGFIEKGLRLLPPGEDGALCYICADRWLQNQYGRKLRRMVAQHYHIDTIIRMHDVDAFAENVSAYPAIIRLDRGTGKIRYADCSARFAEKDAQRLKQWLVGECAACEYPEFSAALLNQPTDDRVLMLADHATVNTVSKLMEQFPSIEKTGVKLGIGLATGRDDVFLVDSPDVVEPERMLPAFNMRDWRRGKGGKGQWLINPWNRDGSLVRLDDYPRFRNYMETHRDSIGSRHVARKSADAWYRTIDKVNWSIYGSPMLLFPDMAMRADPVYSDGSKYPCHNCYWLASDRWDLKVLGGLLMSDIAEAFINTLGVKMRGGTMRFQAQYLRLIHVPEPDTISPEVAAELRAAFDNNDRVAASRAAAVAYGMEGNVCASL